MTAPAVTSVRAGDRDRERTANQLGQALSQGYLAMDEYENRLQATFAAHTTGQLRQLVADLPLARLHRNDPQRQAARRRAAQLGVRIHLGAYLAMVVIVLMVWLAVGLMAGAWYFWPIWPTSARASASSVTLYRFASPSWRRANVTARSTPARIA